MKRGKKLQKRLNARVKAYQEALENPKYSKYPGCITCPGSRSSKGK